MCNKNLKQFTAVGLFLPLIMLFLFNLSTAASIPIHVDVDILPGEFPNEIDPASYKAVVVVILSTEEIEAIAIDPLSVEFGPAGAKSKGDLFRYKDVNRDGMPDLALFSAPLNQAFHVVKPLPLSQALPLTAR